jgi:hypothetical protein
MLARFVALDHGYARPGARQPIRRASAEYAPSDYSNVQFRGDGSYRFVGLLGVGGV